MSNIIKYTSARKINIHDHLENDNPLAPALTALMKASREGRPRQKQVSLQRTLDSGVDEARQVLLTNLIETYLKLSAEETAEFQSLVAQSEEPEVEEMLSVYEERGMVKKARNVLLNLMRIKFGELPEQVDAKVRSITDEEVLDTLLERILTAETLAGMKLEEA